MTVALGIDAGGTYTDVVVYSLRDRAVYAKAKSLTTPGRYSEGIANALRQLPRKWLEAVCFAGLSTTLATNAVVTGRRSRAGLILMGLILAVGVMLVFIIKNLKSLPRKNNTIP